MRKMIFRCKQLPLVEPQNFISIKTRQVFFFWPYEGFQPLTHPPPLRTDLANIPKFQFRKGPDLQYKIQFISGDSNLNYLVFLEPSLNYYHTPFWIHFRSDSSDHIVVLNPETTLRFDEEIRKIRRISRLKTYRKNSSFRSNCSSNRLEKLKFGSVDVCTLLYRLTLGCEILRLLDSFQLYSLR